MRQVFGVGLSALAMFVFGFLYWGVNPLPYRTLSHVANDEAAGKALLEHFPRSGMYVVPGVHLDEAAMTRLHEAGPLAYLSFRREGGPVMEPSAMVKGFALYLVVALFLLGLLRLVAPDSRSKVAGMAAMAGALFVDYGDVVWWYMPLAWKTHQALYDFMALLIGGLVVAKFAPKPGESV